MTSPAMHHARRRWIAMLGVAGSAVALAATAPQAASAAPRAAVAAAASNCPSPYPVKAVHRGIDATGYTTSQGRTPQPFAAHVLGVLKDGISPGIDLIVIRVHSPAVRRAGGVWAGMSGSPIYAPDGRLLGALSYSFSFGPSNTAGVTPAAAMYKLFGIGKRAGTVHPAAGIGFSTTAQRRLVRLGAATAEQAASGMRYIPTPVTVSGVPARGFAKLHTMMAKVLSGPFDLESGGTVAPQAVAPRSTMRPGAPFVASVSTGDVTMAGIGTTTAVCNGRVLAFGHPMLGGGRTEMTMHTGNVLYIQRDPAESPFVMANVGGRTGVIRQDRLTGLRARLGAKPRHLTKIVTHVSASTGLHRTGRSYTPLIGWVPDTAANALYGSMLSTLQKYGTGSGHLGYAIFGRRAGGTAFHVRRSDYVASNFDVAFEAADELYGTAASLAENPYRHIHISRIVASAHLSDVYRQWNVARLQIRRNGRYEKPTRVRVAPGSTLHLRARLRQSNAIAPVRYVKFTVAVPKSARRFGFVDVVGGENLNRFFRGGGGSFNGVLRRIKNAPHNASLVLRSEFDTGHRGITRTEVVRLDRAVTGNRSFAVRLPGGGPKLG